jgi:hypothetical protein
MDIWTNIINIFTMIMIGMLLKMIYIICHNLMLCQFNLFTVSSVIFLYHLNLILTSI